MQQPRPEGMPEGFNKYEKQDGKGVIGLLDSIIYETDTMLKDAARDEQQDQTDYELFVQETNRGIYAREKTIVEEKATKATNVQKLIEEQASLRATKLEITQQENEAAQLHKACDYTLK